eukprot:CAMPEP_0172728228 /NCGR_PEP_ID=MMETSP1074-20121228/92122_1 /TAXON_ID=2916 /ORGANISM="Ceratium fusus, Strain PA161109" /LENGTH=173 /DNA_ID=CAMNT_0013555451 /DNA_START=645 /DNA_END=1167 /DNA_ORIENTATION=-
MHFDTFAASLFHRENVHQERPAAEEPKGLHRSRLSLPREQIPDGEHVALDVQHLTMQARVVFQVALAHHISLHTSKQPSLARVFSAATALRNSIWQCNVHNSSTELTHRRHAAMRTWLSASERARAICISAWKAFTCSRACSRAWRSFRVSGRRPLKEGSVLVTAMSKQPCTE